MSNFYFAQFYVCHNGNIMEAVGSDGVCYLDGRHSKINQSIAARTHIERLKKLNKGFVGFSLHYGTFSRNRVVQSFQEV